MTVISEEYVAIVADNNDEEKRGRIRVVCAGILGDEETIYDEWVEPAFPWGWFFVPDVGEQVSLEVSTASSEDEHAGQFTIDNMNPTWKGVRYITRAEINTGDTDEETTVKAVPRPVNDIFLTNYGKRRGFATPGGHVLMFDDTNDKREISLTWSKTDDASEVTTFTIDKDGVFKLTVLDGNNTLKLEGSGASAIATLGDGKMSATIAEHMEELWTAMKMLYDVHAHTSPVGLTGPPVVPINEWESKINSNHLKIPDL